MGELFKRARVCVYVCLAVLGGAVLGGVAAGFDERPRQASQSSSVVAQASAADIAQGSAAHLTENSAADTVNSRFPADWDEPVRPAPAMLAFASAEHTSTLFSGGPAFPLNRAKASEPEIEEAPETTASSPPGPAPARVALASTSSKPAVVAPRRSNAVLNDSQLASIKRRLNLTPEQERYWPAVEAQLRKMEYKRDGSGRSTGRTASIDMSKVDVQGLKSAGFPLVMSFNEDQKRELRSLAHLLGLESVISTF
jgi:hypothetical protein